MHDVRGVRTEDVGAAVEDLGVDGRRGVVALWHCDDLALVPELQQRVGVLDVVRLVEHDLRRLAEPPEAQDAREQGHRERPQPAREAVGGHRDDEPVAERGVGRDGRGRLGVPGRAFGVHLAGLRARGTTERGRRHRCIVRKARVWRSAHARNVEGAGTGASHDPDLQTGSV